MLVSILHFAPHEPQTDRWLGGAGGGERALQGVTPSSPGFVEYATSDRARALLSVTPEWWERRGTAASVRYEDLVADPAGELERILGCLHAEPLRSPADAVVAASFGRLRAEAANRHFWRGEPGGWRRLLTEQAAVPIAAAHAPLLRRLGYTVPLAGLPADAAADACWRAVARPLSATSSAPLTGALQSAASMAGERRWRGRRRMDGSGLVVWLTGLPGAGKTTLALLLEQQLKAEGVPASVVDGDDARGGAISQDLGFSRRDRGLNVDRIAWVASKVARAGAVAIVASVSPYADDRVRARTLVEADGGRFLEVHVDTPLEVCRERDPKGLYTRAARGDAAGVTGLNDPYEAPLAPDLAIGGFGRPAAACAGDLLEAVWRTAGAGGGLQAVPRAAS